MGDLAEQLIDREMFGHDHEDWNYTSCAWNEEVRRIRAAERKIQSIRKEIAILVNEKGVELEEARRQMNIKYRKGWRERGLFIGDEDDWTDEELKDFL